MRRNSRGSGIRALLLNLLAAALVGPATSLHAQTNNPSIESLDLPLISPDSVPATGTFYLLSSLGTNGFGPPWPFNPVADQGVDAFWLGSNTFGNAWPGSFIVDDTVIDYEALSVSMSMNSPEPPPAPGEGGPYTNTPMKGYDYLAGSFFLEVEPGWISNGFLGVSLHGTLPGVTYDIYSKPSLSGAVSWVLEQELTGAEEQDWTFTWISLSGRSNLFLKATSWADNTGTAIPDWWWIKYFQTTADADAYADPDEDGWSNLAEFQNGTSPISFNTPPSPTGLVARFTGSNSVTFTWNPSPGPVTGYYLVRDVPELGTSQGFNLSSNAVSFVDNPFPLPAPSPLYSPPTYSLQVKYSRGDSGWSQVPLYKNNHDRAFVVRGPQGRSHIIVAGVPSGTAILRLARYDERDSPASVTNFDVAFSSFTNGVYRIPDAWAPPMGYGYQWWISALDQSKRLLEVLGYGFNSSTVPFFDGREQLRDNAIFLLRAADEDDAFWFNLVHPNGVWDLVQYPSDYVFAGLHNLDEFTSPTLRASLDELRPFRDNYLFRNFVFSPADVDQDGFMTTGIILGQYNWLLSPPTHVFSPPAGVTAVTNLLAPNQAQWLFHYGLSATTFDDTSRNWVIDTSLRNHFGLSFASAAFAKDNSGQFSVLYVGGPPADTDGWEYDAAVQPVLVTTGYYFCRPLLPGGSHLSDPFPGHTSFAVTNTSPLLIASLGQSDFQIAGYAKQQLMNGYPNKFSYLGQYFDKAYRMNTNGDATTNQTGVLSEYGDFFPTEPGPTALMTMTNWGTTERGTAVVHVVSLSVDANHDGLIDSSLTGPDFTSPSNPFRFWVNNDHDFSSGSEDGYVGNDVEVTTNSPWIAFVDHSIIDYKGQYIECQRDLEDFARLWICGMPVFTANGGYQVTLSWTDASTNTVAINLVHTIETNGEMGYLTDTNVAKAQVNPIAYSYPSYKFAHVSPSQPYTFPASYFTNAGNKYFLFEGAGTGSGQLVLTISQATALGTNVIAQAGAWLDLHDIKDFYESSGHHEQHRRGDEQLERRSQDSAVSNRLRCQRVTGPHRHGSWHQRGQLALGERKRDRF